MYNLDNAPDPERRARMEQLAEQGICIFCPPHVDGRGETTKRGLWQVSLNEYPYEGTERHLLLSPRRHVTSLMMLTSAEEIDFWEALHVMFGSDHFSLWVRNGDTRYTGATIEHLHVHVVTSDGSTPIRVSLS